jgi:chaperonin cofactor prefoldin
LQKTVDTLSQQKQSTIERLSKIQSENTDLKSRYEELENFIQMIFPFQDF